VVNGVAGGVIRDVLLSEKPLVLTGQIYAIAALVGASTYWVIDALGGSSYLTIWIPVIVTVGLRLIAVSRNWTLPVTALGPQRNAR